MNSLNPAPSAMNHCSKPVSYEKRWNVVDIKRIIRRLEKEAGEADWLGDAPLADELREKISRYRLKLALGTTHDVDF